METAEQIRRPGLRNALMEMGLAPVELWSHYLSRPLVNRLPQGDGHVVIVLPGFLASDLSTKPLRAVLSRLGYSAYGWGMGRNLVYNSERENALNELLHRAYSRQKRPVSLIGWSLGGLFAREMAKNHPDMVRLVISLGSPFTGDLHKTNARKLFAQINGEPERTRPEVIDQLHVVPPVPFTSVFTKTDGIVPWKMSVQRGDQGQFENIQIPASHLGIGVNPLAIQVIADRLAQAEGEWAPFEREGVAAKIFQTEH
jgi:pimeloyl-ACP methyl ester carboxylesterase